MIEVVFLYIFINNIVLFGKIDILFPKSTGQVRVGEVLGKMNQGNVRIFRSNHPDALSMYRHELEVKTSIRLRRTLINEETRGHRSIQEVKVSLPWPLLLTIYFFLNLSPA